MSHTNTRTHHSSECLHHVNASICALSTAVRSATTFRAVAIFRSSSRSSRFPKTAVSPLGETGAGFILCDFTRFRKSSSGSWNTSSSYFSFTSGRFGSFFSGFGAPGSASGCSLSGASR